MKTLMMSLLALTLSSSAHAGYFLVLETCTSMNVNPDHSYTVSIQGYHGSRVGVTASEETSNIAVVTEDTIAGPQQIGSFDVSFKAPSAHIVGSRGAYLGTGFSLSFPVVPQEDGGTVANLYIPGNGTRDDISDTLICHGDL